MKQKSIETDFKYLIVNEQDKKFGLSVNTVGSQLIKAGVHYPLTNHPSGYFFNASKGRVLHEYQLVYITRGKGILSFDKENEIPLSKGQVFIVYPGQWHTYQPLLETGWDEYYIGFEGAMIDDIVANSFLQQQNHLFEVGLKEELVNQFVRAIEIAKKDETSVQQYLAGIVMHILGFVISTSQNKMYEEVGVAQKIEQAKIIMNNNIYEMIDVKDLASDLNMGYTCFRKLFKEYTGYPPANYFNELKIRKARQLLLENSYSTKEIAFKLGYNSTEYFFTLFKKKTGLTPAEYRVHARGTKSQNVAQLV